VNKRTVATLLDRIINSATLMGGAAVALMMVHITADVVLRFFGLPLPGTVSMISYYYMLVVTFVALAFAERRNAHIAVDIVYDLMPRWMQAVCRVATLLLCLAAFSLLTLKTWDVALGKYAIQAKFVQGGTVVTTWPGYFLLPLGFGLVWLTCLMKLLRVFVDPPATTDQDDAS